MLKATNVIKGGKLGENGWLRYEYIRKRRSAKKRIGTQVSKRDKHKGEEERRERRVNNVTICTNLASSDELVERDTPLFYKINLFFFVLILGQSPLLLFVSLSYKFY